MIFSDASPVTFHDPLPAAVDVAIIGGGVIGIAIGWYLQQAGQRVLICEKGRIAGEQSSRNWGWVRQQGRDPAELPIAIDSVNAWEQLGDQLGDGIGFARGGVMFLAETQDDLARISQWLPVAEQYQLDTRMLTGREVDELIKTSPGQWVGGMFTASDGRAEPFTAVPTIATALQQQGDAIIREQCAVRGLDVQAGRVRGIVTEDGTVAADTVVCAGGLWSTTFLAHLGISLPQLGVRSTVARTAPGPDLYGGAATSHGVAIRRRHDGGYTIAGGPNNDHLIGLDSFKYYQAFQPARREGGRYMQVKVFGDNFVERFTPTRRWADDQVSPFERTRVLNPKPSSAALTNISRALATYYPALSEQPFVEAWAGMMDATPDVVPVMDAVTGYPGLYLATGFSGHGFGFGLGAGQVMADMILGRPAKHDLTRFRFDRFYDGSPMIPGPGL